MKNIHLPQVLVNRVRAWSERPGLLQFKHLVRYWQTRRSQHEFERMQALASRPELAALLAYHPRFAYKYLRSYAATCFSRSMREAAIAHHYRLLAEVACPDFVARVATQPVLWQEQAGDREFSIALAFPLRATFVGELSLHFYQGATLLQMLSCVLVPGYLVGLAAPHALLITQVQGTRDSEAVRQAGKLLHDSTPSSLLLNAAYGLADALGVAYAAGISNNQQIDRDASCRFDYDGFWGQFHAPRLPSDFYLLDPAAPERPLEEIKPKYRSRRLRRRAFKQQMRQQVAATVRAGLRPAEVVREEAYCDVA